MVSVRVNLVNAALLAERRGMNLIERKKHQTRIRLRKPAHAARHIGRSPLDRARSHHAG